MDYNDLFEIGEAAAIRDYHDKSIISCENPFPDDSVEAEGYDNTMEVLDDKYNNW